MAYVNFSELPSGAPTLARAAPDPAAGGFAPIEWLVIGLARADPLASLAEPGRLARAMRSLFGVGARSRLADHRLERLRRLAVLTRHHGWRLPTSEIAAFLGEFSAAQLETVIAAVGRDQRRRAG